VRRTIPDDGALRGLVAAWIEVKDGR
jgi:hypothetical protein